MKIGKLIAVVAFGSLVVAAGCGDDEEENTTTTPTPTTTTTTPTTSAGGAGQGGSTTSGGGMGGGMGGEGGGASCLSCATFLVSITTAQPSDLCGYEGGDFQNGLQCEAGSSCEKFSDYIQCSCDPNTCGAACGDNGCMGMPASQACISCGQAMCQASNDACLND